MILSGLQATGEYKLLGLQLTTGEISVLTCSTSPSPSKTATPTSPSKTTTINIIADLWVATGSTAPDGSTVGPLTFTLTNTSTKATKTDTSGNACVVLDGDTEGYPGCVNITSEGGTGTQINLNGTFTAVKPGNYTVSVSGISAPPQTITVAGTPINLIFGGSVLATSAASTSTCEASGGELSWLICGIIDTINGAETDIMTDIVQPLLITKPLAFNADCDKPTSTCSANDKLGATIYKVWSNFRVYGDVILVIALLVVVFGEAIGGGVIDAYTAKKILPRILIAAILINLSIYIAAALEDIINVIGGGLNSLIRLPFEHIAANGSALASATVSGSGTGYAISAVGLVLAAIVTAGIITGVGIPILLFAALALMLATLGILVTLAIRQGLIIFLILVSPIAFALYVLPNTEQYFKKWWSLLIKTLMVYPIVMAVFAMSYVTGVVMSNFGVHPPFLADIMSLIAMVAPLFLIPFAFKLSGGIIGNVQGMISGVTNRIRKPAWGMAKGSTVKKLGNYAAGHGFKGGNATNWRGTWNRGIQAAMKAHTVGWNPTNWRANMRTAIGTSTDTEIAENMEKNRDYASRKGDDTWNRAANESHDRKSFMEWMLRNAPNRYKEGVNDPALADDAAVYERVRRSMSADAFSQMTAVQAIAGCTAFDNEGDLSTGMTWEAVARAGLNDDGAIRRMIAQGKQALMQGGKVEAGAAGYGVIYDGVTRMRDEIKRTGTLSQDTIKSVTESIENSSADTSTPGQAVYGKETSAKHLATAHSRGVNEALKKYYSLARDVVSSTSDEERATKMAELREARRVAEQKMAATGGIYDAMLQASPQNARAYADGLNSVPLELEELPAELAVDPSIGGLDEDIRTDRAGNYDRGPISIVRGMENMRTRNQGWAEMRHELYSEALKNPATPGAGPAPGLGGLPSNPIAGGPPPGIR
jgi:hypothetical protein